MISAMVRPESMSRPVIHLDWAVKWFTELDWAPMTTMWSLWAATKAAGVSRATLRMLLPSTRELS